MTKTYSDIDAVTRLLEEVRPCRVKPVKVEKIQRTTVHADCEALWSNVIMWSDSLNSGCFMSKQVLQLIFKHNSSTSECQAGRR